LIVRFLAPEELRHINYLHLDRILQGERSNILSLKLLRTCHMNKAVFSMILDILDGSAARESNVNTIEAF